MKYFRHLKYGIQFTWHEHAFLGHLQHQLLWLIVFALFTLTSYWRNVHQIWIILLCHFPVLLFQFGFFIFRPYFIWERKIFKSNGFFLQNLPRFYLYLNLRVLPIEFNPHKFSFVRYVFVEIFEVFF